MLRAARRPNCYFLCSKNIRFHVHYLAAVPFFIVKFKILKSVAWRKRFVLSDIWLVPKFPVPILFSLFLRKNSHPKNDNSLFRTKQIFRMIKLTEQSPKMLGQACRLRQIPIWIQKIKLARQKPQINLSSVCLQKSSNSYLSLLSK